MCDLAVFVAPRRHAVISDLGQRRSLIFGDRSFDAVQVVRVRIEVLSGCPAVACDGVRCVRFLVVLEVSKLCRSGGFVSAAATRIRGARVLQRLCRVSARVQVDPVLA
jgi:hypothetical protein